MALGLKSEEIEIEINPTGLERAFQTTMQRKVNAILTASARVILAERRGIVQLASKYRLPAIYPQEEFVDDGGLMFYGVERVDQYRRAAVYVDKTLRDTKSADLPVERPTKFEFVINLKAATQIALPIPPNVLVRADRVIR